ncbi:MAG: HAD-IA family hydrolase [Luteolibacter sp.]
MITHDNHWIAFDAAGTLFEPAEPVENIYADCFSTLGFGIPESTWKAAFGKAYLITPDPIFPEDGDGDAIEKEWWHEMVRRAAEAAGIRPDPVTMTDAFEEIFEHYSAGAAWKLFPEVDAVLASLKAKGISLAITSNYDSRLHRVVKELGIAQHFDLILTSAEARARKPAPLILEKLFADTGANPATTCLAGDSLTCDKGSAEAAGIPFYHIDRPATDLSSFEIWHTETFFQK